MRGGSGHETRDIRSASFSCKQLGLSWQTHSAPSTRIKILDPVCFTTMPLTKEGAFFGQYVFVT